jgi:hypothetical protein
MTGSELMAGFRLKTAGDFNSFAYGDGADAIAPSTAGAVPDRDYGPAWDSVALGKRSHGEARQPSPTTQNTGAIVHKMQEKRRE